MLVALKVVGGEEATEGWSGLAFTGSETADRFFP